MNVKTEVEKAIRSTVLDYAEGWYEGDAERMERCLHAWLAKRQLRTDSGTGNGIFVNYRKSDMVELTKQGLGKRVPRDRLYYDIQIVEIFREVAIVRCESALYVDFLQMVYEKGKWLIVNVLFSSNEPSGQ